MSAAANQLIARQEGCRVAMLVAALTHLYQGTLAFVTAAGYADDDTATGANKFAGVVVGEVDNSAGAAGDLTVELHNEGIFPLVGSGFTQADVGKVCYASDNYTITTTYAPGCVRIGRVKEYVSATVVRVQIETDPPNGSEYTSLAASTAISNTVAQTAFDTAFNIPANSLRPGDVIRVRAQGIATATNSTDTLAATLRIGNTDVVATPAVDVANNDIFVIEADLVVRTIGAGGTFVAAGMAGIGASGSATMRPVFKASTALDTTAAQSVNVTATWSVANAGNSCRLDVMTVQIIRKG